MSNNKFKILLVEDDANISSFVETLLNTNGYQVVKARTCAAGVSAFLSHIPDLVILDLGLPDRDGMEFIRTIRKESVTPIIVLSARTTERDKVSALDLGANDYISKPFGNGELLARVRSHLRRYNTLGDVNADADHSVFRSGRLAYRPEDRTLLADGEPVRLTATETKIVDLLMRNLGRVFPAEEIYRRVWGEEPYAAENTVMVHIRRIREKIELNPKEPEYLKVVWGIGYKMEKR